MKENTVYEYVLGYHEMNDVKDGICNYTLHIKNIDKELYNEVLPMYNQCEEFFNSTSWTDRLTGTKFIFKGDVNILEKIACYLYEKAKITESMCNISNYYGVHNLTVQPKLYNYDKTYNSSLLKDIPKICPHCGQPLINRWDFFYKHRLDTDYMCSYCYNDIEKGRTK